MQFIELKVNVGHFRATFTQKIIFQLLVSWVQNIRPVDKKRDVLENFIGSLSKENFLCFPVAGHAPH